MVVRKMGITKRDVNLEKRWDHEKRMEEYLNTGKRECN
jgi:hypothetical protein